ncbi:hypothetical protein RDWZM_004476 [Blomia tropicalis]|uniref:Uncharacterized protein n=1 Tax=Blomia tropicalis TaxID=40697 RepID=A0A9Q0MH65_BLOTA|nr:hypothetical protein RDWZM_004476 [Blomia tropicalis]
MLCSDCGGSCGGGCGYSNPCGNVAPAPVIETDCGYGGCNSGGSNHRTTSTQSGYHKTVTTVEKEERNDHLKIVIQPQQKVIRRTYVEPQPTIIKRRTTYIEPTYHAPLKKHRYVENYGDSTCDGPCGGSKVVKIIKKTTYADDTVGCTTCGNTHGQLVYDEQPTVVRKVTKIINRPAVTKVITKVVSEPSDIGYGSSVGYRSGLGVGGYGGVGRYGGIGGGGVGGVGSRSNAGAFAYASAGASSSSGGYNTGGCQSGCDGDQWKKKK